ncbi:MAG: hypothetical protein ACI4JC_03495 [Faecalibacterium sp.]
MNAIQTSENKTLKLTNVVSRRIRPEEMGNMSLVLTQMNNLIKSNNAQPIGPLIQHVDVSGAHESEPVIELMIQANQLIPRLDPGYHQDAVLRVRGCMYAHFTGPLDKSQFASQKLQIQAFEQDVKLSGNVYTIYVKQDDEDSIVDVFMETKA